MLARLHQSQMTLGQHHLVIARDRTHHRNSKRRERIGDQRAMPVAAELVQHDAADANLRIERRKARRNRRRRLRLA